MWRKEILIWSTIIFLATEVEGLEVHEVCRSSKTCGECISSNCLWCSEHEFKNVSGFPMNRCDTATGHAAKPEIIRCPSSKLLTRCDCERPGSLTYERNSPLCNYAGTYKCGICECNDNFFGGSCECTGKYGAQLDLDQACRLDITTDIICSGRGRCVCGVCECNMRADPSQEITGRYCQCDNFSCDRSNGLLCSGEDHGTCECGICKCNPGWTGPACECSIDVDQCKDPTSGKVCNDRGKCTCGKCECFSTNPQTYSGKFCEQLSISLPSNIDTAFVPAPVPSVQPPTNEGHKLCSNERQTHTSKVDGFVEDEHKVQMLILAEKLKNEQAQGLRDIEEHKAKMELLAIQKRFWSSKLD